MNNERKSGWLCPDCKSKRPKNDNSNTPIRDVTGDGAANVTRRPTKVIQPNYVTEDTLRSVLREELTATIKDLIAVELRGLRDEVTSFKSSLEFFDMQYTDYEKKLKEKSVIISDLEKANVSLTSTVHDLTSRLSLVEQHMRESNLEINGIPEHKTENLPSTILQLSKAVDSTLTDEEILHVTRVAKMDKDSDRPRAVIVKLRSQRHRDAVLAAVSKFNKKKADENKLSSHHLGYGGPRVPVFVSEHLTPENKSLHAATRKLSKELGYKFVWVRNGRIYIRKDEDAQAIYIRNRESLKLINPR